MKFFFKIIFLCCFQNVFAQSGVQVFDSLGTPAILISNGKLFDTGTDMSNPDGSVIFTVRGNLIFNGNNETRDHIFFLVKGTDLFSKKTSQLIYNQNQQPVYAVSRGRVFIGANKYSSHLEVGRFEKMNDGSVVFTNQHQKTPLFSVEKNVSTAELMAVFAFFAVQYDIGKELMDSLQSAKPAGVIVTGNSTIRRLWTGGVEEFLWDGQLLRNRWRFDDFEHWTFDGTVLRRAWYDTGEDFIWNGSRLQRRYMADNLIFEVDGNNIRPVFGAMEDEFFIQGNIIKRSWTNLGTDEWEVNGEIPLPVIILVLYRIAR